MRETLQIIPIQDIQPPQDAIKQAILKLILFNHLMELQLVEVLLELELHKNRQRDLMILKIKT